MKRTSLPLHRRDFITLLSGAGAWPLAARAQQGERVRRVGVLMSVGESDPEAQTRVAIFRDALQRLGWTDGRNVQFVHRWPGADADRRRSSAVEYSFATSAMLASLCQQRAGLGLRPISRHDQYSRAPSGFCSRHSTIAGSGGMLFSLPVDT